MENEKQGVKHIFAGSLRVASVLSQDNYSSTANPSLPKSPGTAYYFHADHLGSTGVVTDDAGAVHQSLEYFVDGEQWIDRAPTTPVAGYLFNGKPFDRDTNFYDFGQRFYDPRTSLWLGVDPGFTDDASGSVGRPVVLSVSAYAGNNPANAIDPDGRDFGESRMSPLMKQKLSRIIGDNVVGYIVAGAMFYEEDDLEYYDPSSLIPQDDQLDLPSGSITVRYGRASGHRDRVSRRGTAARRGYRTEQLEASDFRAAADADGWIATDDPVEVAPLPPSDDRVALNRSLVEPLRAAARKLTPPASSSPGTPLAARTRGIPIVLFEAPEDSARWLRCGARRRSRLSRLLQGDRRSGRRYPRDRALG